MGVPVSLLVITRNEEPHIAACLSSVSWADEALVVDSGSTDGTRRLAEEGGASVLEHPFETHARQKNWGLQRVRNRWVLCLDADERATPGLQAEVASVIGAGGCAAYRLPRRNWLLGDFVRHGSWARDRVVRLLDRERCRFADRRVHERVLNDGPVGDLRSAILHYTCEDLPSYMVRADAYARLGAEDAAERGSRAGVGRLVLVPPMRFLRSYLLWGGFLDGRRGLLQACLTAYGAWLKYFYLAGRNLERRTR